jgi:predicted helicase
VEGELRQEACLARLAAGGKLKGEKNGIAAVKELLEDFLVYRPQEINTPRELAERMARLTHMIRDIIIAAFENSQASALLQGWRDAFARVLLADLNQPEKTSDFADMFAQTLAYGLFTARVMDSTPGTFTRQKAQYLIPKSNPFLRDFFIQITGPQLDDEPFAGFVNDLAKLLANTDMAAVLADFGRRTRQEDPVVHFYETFLAAYDPKLRESRGVYYTPEPVVSYIVRSVDGLLKNSFNCPEGLADSTRISIPNVDPARTVKGKKQIRKTTESHKVLILDPATGTGTFLYAVIDSIRRQFMAQGNTGMWPGYVRNHLLPRLFGFELLMAPYAFAHFKLGLQLAGCDLPEAQRESWAYVPADDERLGIYLTNALEEAHEMTGLPLFTQWVADETNAANEIKSRLPVLVVMGNPPYSGHSANNSKWIADLLRGRLPGGGNTGNYYEVDGKPLGEKNPKWLQDDYVKFIRFGQWRIEQSGQGILAFISNHGYLDNPTFRGMRQSLMQTFTDIYLLDLHGNAKKRETAPDGGKDENVFDIQQGVAIGIFVKQPGKTGSAKVYHGDLWGTRSLKYARLFEEDVASSPWRALTPQAPFYLFSQQDSELKYEYEKLWGMADVSQVNVLGFQSHRDHFAVDFEYAPLLHRIGEMCDVQIQDENLRERYDLRDNGGWKLESARTKLRLKEDWENDLIRCLYRSFDWRFCYFSEVVMDRPRRELKSHVAKKENLCLGLGRQGIAVNDPIWSLIAIAREPIDANIFRRGGINIFPLYLYPIENDTKQVNLLEDADKWSADAAHGDRVPNLNPKFVAEMERRLNLTFTPANSGDLKATFGPEDIFSYIYAFFHSPTYRSRYAEFLKIDFPRVPLTSDLELFTSLCLLGRELVGLHLLESPQLGQFLAQYPIAGDNRVEKGYPRYVPPRNEEPGRVAINANQYFEGVPPEIWEFYIGGYQVCEKWLKDRRGRQLSYDDLTHYQKILVAIQKTLEIMEQIDNAIPQWPIA